jgi:hypothetical protein
VFTNLTRFSVIGNDGLCGGVAELKFPPCEVKPHSSTENGCSSRFFSLPPASLYVYLFYFLSSFYSKGEEDRTKPFVGQVP